MYLTNLFFHSLEKIYIVQDHIDASFPFFLQKNFYIVHDHIDFFVFFLLQKDFSTIHKPFLKVFLYFFFDNFLLALLYIRRKK